MRRDERLDERTENGPNDEGRDANVAEDRPDIAFELPRDSDRLDPRHVIVGRIATMIVAGVVVIAIGVVAIITTIANRPIGGIGIGLQVLAVMGSAALVFLAWWYPAAAYRRCGYRLTDAGFEIRRGILWRSIHIVPHARLQHADVTQGPLQRRYDLATLTIHTAGTSNASVILEGLTHATASGLRDRLIANP